MLRELHEAIRSQLAETFPGADVRKHTGEVDIETIQRHAMKRANFWVTVAAGEGLDDSSDTELRVLVEWAVFVIAGAGLELVVDAGEQKRRRLEPVEAAEHFATEVLRLAHDNDWNVEGCSKARRTDLRFINLGVGLKPTARGIDRADVGLFVVWGRQELALGENILPGRVELPNFSGFGGDFESQGPASQRAGARIRVELTPSPAAWLRSAAGSLFINSLDHLRSRRRKRAA